MWGRKIILPLALCAAQGAVSAEFEPFIVLGAGLIYDDNSTRTPKKNSDTERILNAAVGGSDDGRWLDYNVNYKAVRRSFDKDTFDARTTINGDGTLRLHNEQRSLNWVVENSETTTVVDVLNADTVDNEQQRSQFSTGPEINLNLGRRDVLSVSARRTQLDLDESGLDSERDSAEVSLQHRLSPKTYVFLRGSFENVDFDPFADLRGSDNNYEREMYSVGFGRQINNGAFSISVGQSVITPDLETRREIKTPHYSVQLDVRHFGGDTNFTANRALTDQSAGADSGFRSLVEDLENSGGLTDFGALDASLIIRTGVSLYHQRNLFSSQNTLRMGVAWNENEQEEFSRTDSSLEFSIEYNHKLTSSTSLYLTSSYQVFERSIDDEDLRDTVRGAGIGFNTELLDKVSLGCGYHYRERDEDFGDGHNANVWSCRVNYQLL